jgi:hypothetical protein
VEQAPAASNVTVLAQALQAILDEARKPRANKTAAKKPPGRVAAQLQAARCSLAPDGARIRPRR